MKPLYDGKDDLYFLAGGGEMGERIRSTDWSQTPLGHPKTWPQCLQTSVAMMLDNPFGMYIAWGREYIQLYNNGYRPILGSNKHPQALGISTRETFSEVWHIIGSMFDGVMEGKAVGFPDFMLPLNRHGFVEECYFDFSYSPIRKEDGEVGGVLVTVIETTSKRRAEVALKESEERFKAMADNIPNLAWMADAKGNIFWYNKRWFDFTGTTLEEMEGWGWQSVHDPEKLPEVLRQWTESISSGEPFEMIFPIRGKNGKFRQFLTRIAPVVDSEGNIYQWFGSNTDITTQIESEQALKESETRLEEAEQNLRNTIIQAPVAMCLFRGTNHVVDLTNERMLELWGKTAKDVLKKPIFEGLPEAKDQGFEELLDHVYKSGETYAAEGVSVNLPRDGKIEKVYINFVYAPYKESDGRILGVLALAIDVTAQVLARQQIEEVVDNRTKELADANISLQRSNAELAQFAYIASHDLQEPLRKVSTFAQMLEQSMGTLMDERSRNYMDKINAATARMLTLIRDVLAYSQLSNEFDVFSKVNLEEVIDIIEKDFELLIDQKKGTIQCGPLPVIDAIPLQMSQLFGNLISNALKFSSLDVPPVIQIHAELINDAGTDKYHITCRDNGIGFIKQYEEKIFSIFQRLHGKHEYSGTGIGLAMCKKIVQNHNGEIYAEGGEGGAVFHIILPALHNRS